MHLSSLLPPRSKPECLATDQSFIDKVEVFLRNIPIDLNEDGLKVQLEPFMKRLQIVDFICEKPRKKGHGNVTFLNRRDGERFLDRHGTRKTRSLLPSPAHPPVYNLRFMGTDILCELSRRPQPQAFTLRALEHAAQERTNPLYTTEEDTSAIVFRLASFNCGYYAFHTKHLAYVPQIWWNQCGIVKCTKRNFVVKLENSYLIRIPLSTIVELVWESSGLLTLTLSTVPLFFMGSYLPMSDADPILSGLRGLVLKSGIYPPQEVQHNRLCALGEKHAELVGQCLIYQFKVSTEELLTKINKLKKREIAITRYSVSVPSSPAFNPMPFVRQLKAFKAQIEAYTAGRLVPFEILFQLQALVDNAYILPSVALDLARMLRKETEARKAGGKLPVSVDAMRKLFYTIDWPSPHGIPTDFDANSIFNSIKQNEKELKHEHSCVTGISNSRQKLTRICRVTVTPSRITLHGPEMEPNNRILRKFPNHHEYFIRVQFCDENGQDIFFSPQVNNRHVFARFKKILKGGIEIAGRTYTFLGFSHSSLRAHSVWFSAPFVDDDRNLQTYFTIIKALGKFSHITSPARCAARIGQAFSETPFSVDVEKMKIDYIPDIVSPDHQRVFSDGIGAVSQEVIQAIWESLPPSKGSPTCAQVRLGGAKGMLALNSRLAPGSVINLRPSMVKFPSDDLRVLEICDVGSKPIPLVLNRQIIKIMEDMKVPERWFFHLQEIQLTDLRKITSTVENTVKYVKRQSISQSLRLHKLFHYFNALGIDYRKENFLRSVIEILVLRELRLLKHKARILVPKGVTLFGIIDETGFLKEDEVFVTYEATRDQVEPPPGPGRVLVTRSPALFDGDIQIAYNTIPPHDHPLSKHRNCIIFSQRGSRDLPSKLSGGDLDGDIFHIIWDPECTPAATYLPADYPRVEPIDIGRLVDGEDMMEFFVNFMETDRLGMIATRHMIMADQSEGGTSHRQCKLLAQLHSRAVDFSKTGIPVRMEELPRTVTRFRPDFLAPGPQAHILNESDIHFDAQVLRSTYDEDDGLGPVQKYYRSEKILGKLYRAIDERQVWSANVQFDVQSRQGLSDAALWDQFLNSVIRQCSSFSSIPWIDHMNEARLIRAAYENAILSAMNDFSEHPIHPISELEVFTGQILSKTGVQNHRQRARSIKLTDEFERILLWIMGLMRPYGNGPIALTGYETPYDALALCIACVHIADEKEESDRIRRRRDLSTELKSFRVVSACALLQEIDLFERGEKP
ncbi:hypothetical protein N7462_002847 [Penicillium macrosclerotiorum]|uniref:uncharacterized protein n=1 Tax=Penicillium macrosclerotiorum TaxID=303699 RepID=UPI0025483124|nr:uncharacterized protein N7462_002847 [Penicillium macrosclerotiorum]KAJ5693424.1 hypothetical protein N7462_002847 [Penicillium macrosclerotiorum]